MKCLYWLNTINIRKINSFELFRENIMTLINRSPLNNIFSAIPYLG